MPFIHYIIAPFGEGAGVLGSECGPDALLKAGLPDRLLNAGSATIGRIRTPNIDPYLPTPNSKCWGHTAAYNRAIHDACETAFDMGQLPLMIGGDHSLAIGSIMAAREHAKRNGRNFLCLYIDAHTDINVPATTPSGNTHGMTIAAAMGYVHWWPQSFDDSLQPEELIYYGIRDVDGGEEMTLERMPSIRQFRCPNYRDPTADLLDELDRLNLDPTETQVHVSFDVDSLDPLYLKSTGLNVEEGLWPSNVEAVLRKLRALNVVQSMDIVEYNPSMDVDAEDAETIIHIAAQLLG